MMFPTRMKQLIAVVRDSDVSEVTKELLRQGVLHFVSMKQIGGGWNSKIESVIPEVSESQIGEIRKRIESFLDLAGSAPLPAEKLDVADLKPVDIKETNKVLDRVASDLQGIRDHQRVIQQEILKLEDIKRQVDLFGDIGAGIRSRSRYSFLSIQTGSIPASGYDEFISALRPVPSVQLKFSEADNRLNILLITLKRDESGVNKIKNQFGWMDVELSRELYGVKDDVAADIDKRLSRLHTEQETLNRDIKNLLDSKLENLNSMWTNLRMNELYYKIQGYFGQTARTMLFSGWLPASRQKSLDSGIKRVTGGRCYLEWHNPADAEVGEEEEAHVPVQFNNPKFLSPFQMLVRNYAIPAYGSVDPTPIVAVAYLCMFGLMFGDAGQGLVLVIAGLLGSFLYRGKSQNVRQLFNLIVWCGSAAVIAGVLFGSYFGVRLFAPLWFDYHGIISGHARDRKFVSDIFDILLITIYFGISVIGLGLLLNWINLIARRQWLKLFLDKGGLLGGWMYGAGVYVAFYFAGKGYKELPDLKLLFLMLGLPALIFIAKPPLEFILHNRHGKKKPFTAFTIIDFLMEWIVEMLEIGSGYLANTLSFMRVAGLGIGHVSLMIAFFQIAGMVAGGTGSYNLISYIILVFGNILVIALEGLSAGVQSLRLNYYEFFSKYFNGTGEAYSPVTLLDRNR
ncbi:MAG: V-type ATPase 116kDa subunit family protein [Spirochaetota bacterium]